MTRATLVLCSTLQAPPGSPEITFTCHGENVPQALFLGGGGDGGLKPKRKIIITPDVKLTKIKMSREKRHPTFSN